MSLLFHHNHTMYLLELWVLICFSYMPLCRYVLRKVVHTVPTLVFSIESLFSQALSVLYYVFHFTHLYSPYGICISSGAFNVVYVYMYGFENLL